MKVKLVGAAAAAVTLGVPAFAQAHPAQVVCGDNGPTVAATAYDGAAVASVVRDGDVFVVTWTDGYRLRLPITVDCPAPTPPPVPEVPEATPPPVTPPPPPTCADLLARYPKAGPVRRAAWGCPTPPVVIPPPGKPPKRPRVITCSFARAHFSPAVARAVLARRGISANCLRPYNPPVTG